MFNSFFFSLNIVFRAVLLMSVGKGSFFYVAHRMKIVYDFHSLKSWAFFISNLRLQSAFVRNLNNCNFLFFFFIVFFLKP